MATYGKRASRIADRQSPSTGELIESLRFYTANLAWLTFALLVFGILAGYSASSTRLISEGLSPMREIRGELGWSLVGLTAMFLIAKFVKFAPNAKGDWLYLFVKCSYWFSVVSLIFVLFNKVVKGSTRTLDLGFIHFQPTEVAKFGLVAYLAYLLLVEHSKARGGSWYLFGNRIPIQLFDVTKLEVRSLGALAVAGLMLILVIIQPDLGSTFLLFTLAVTALSLGGVKKRFIALVFAGAAVMLLLAFLIGGSRFKHAETRIKAWLNPLGTTASVQVAGLELAHKDKESYQILQSLGAVANGGISGKGLFNGVQKINRLPEATNDFIFAVICEELGFAGALAVVAAFCALMYFSCRIALCIRNPFFSALVFLIGFAIFLQAAINMAATVNLVPTTGINLPLISFGGTSRIITLLQIGVILAVANTFIRFESPRVG